MGLLLPNVTCVAIGERGLLIGGAPGSGKSSLALALIDRGAMLIGDDGILLEPDGSRACASPAPTTAGLLEVRNIGLITLETRSAVPVALLLTLDPTAPRYVDQAETLELAGVTLPSLRLWPDSPVLALRAEQALLKYGLDSA